MMGFSRGWFTRPVPVEGRGLSASEIYRLCGVFGLSERRSSTIGRSDTILGAVNSTWGCRVTADVVSAPDGGTRARPNRKTIGLIRRGPHGGLNQFHRAPVPPPEQTPIARAQV